MATVTLAIPDGIRKKMRQFPEINWSGLIRKIIEDKIRLLSWKGEMQKRAGAEKEFNDWTIEMGKKAKKGISERLRKEGILK